MTCILDESGSGFEPGPSEEPATAHRKDKFGSTPENSETKENLDPVVAGIVSGNYSQRDLVQ
jgi:hypothetical protein